jgi:hypothetical protein
MLLLFLSVSRRLLALYWTIADFAPVCISPVTERAKLCQVFYIWDRRTVTVHTLLIRLVLRMSKSCYEYLSTWEGRYE